MNSPRQSATRRGFTLMELMVAMAITVIIVTVLVSITSIAVDTWNRSRAELRAARQAKAMVESMAADFEAMVTRRGNLNEWFTATSAKTLPGDKLLSTNAAELVFFSGSTDRYNGEIGATNKNDKGGDVSCIGYRLYYKDPIDSSGTTFRTFVLNRLLVNPDDTFRDLLGKTDLTSAFTNYSTKLDDTENFLCENVFQFTVTFHIEASHADGTTTKLVTVPVVIGQTSAAQVTSSFKIKGSGIETDATPSGVTADELKGGQITAMEVSLTVLTDYAADQLRNRPFTDSQKSQFLAKNSFQFTKLVPIPRM